MEPAGIGETQRHPVRPGGGGDPLQLAGAGDWFRRLAPGYLGAAAATLAACALRHLFAGYISLPYLFFYPAVMLSAMLGGLGPGLLATGLSALLCTTAPLRAPQHVAGPEALAIFVLMGVSLTIVSERERRAMRRLNESIRKRAQEEASNEGEESFRVLADGSPAIIWVADEHAHTLFINRRFRELLDVTREQISGDGWQRLIHPEDLGAYIATVSVAIERQEGFTGEVRVRLPDELWHRFSIVASPRFSTEGAFLGHAGVCEDITARRQAEEALKESKRRVSTILRLVRTGIIVTRVSDGEILEANDEWLNLTGWSRDEAIGASTARLNLYADPKDRDRLYRAFTAPEGQLRPTEMWIRRKSGELRMCVLSGGSAELEGERCTIGVFHDLTESQSKDAALRESEERLRRTLDGMMEGYAILDRQWRYVYVNDAGAAHTRMAPEALIGRTPMDIFPGFESTDIHAALEQCMNQGVAARVETEVLRSDGSKFWLELSIQPVPEGVVMLGIETTERKRAETARTAMEEQFRQAQKMEAVGRLAGGVAHDFNNLLSVILSYGEEVRYSLPPGEPVNESLDEILKAGRSAAELTKQLLLFSRQQVVAPCPLDLNEQIAHNARMFRRVLGEDIELQIIPAERLALVRADAGNIEQVIMNLVVNARDAMPTGGRLTIETANVELDARYAASHVGATAGPHVLLLVRDTGIGMDKATQCRIFEPFFTTKEPGKGTRRLHLRRERARARDGFPHLPPAAQRCCGSAGVRGPPDVAGGHRDHPARRGRCAGVRSREYHSQAAGISGADCAQRGRGAVDRGAAPLADPPAPHRRGDAANERHGARPAHGRVAPQHEGDLHVGIHR